MPGQTIAPAFFAVVRPDIPDQVAAMAARHAADLADALFPLCRPRITVDIPVILDACRQKFPDVTLELYPTLENDPVLENLLVERLARITSGNNLL